MQMLYRNLLINILFVFVSEITVHLPFVDELFLNQFVKLNLLCIRLVQVRRNEKQSKHLILKHQLKTYIQQVMVLVLQEVYHKQELMELKLLVRLLKKKKELSSFFILFIFNSPKF
jgi:hypothetical protein